MRRPVKPFVTEYKGSARRGKDSRPDIEVEEGKPKAAELKARGSQAGEAKAGSSRTDDSRAGNPKAAAKASGRAARGAAETRGAPPPRGPFRSGEDAEPLDSYEAAMRAADALFSPKGKAGGESTRREEAAPVAGTEEAAGGTAAAPTPAEPTGRVLRALDEPEPVLPEPMPELAPKRRGRKPGSVNRPKPGTRAPEAARRRLAETAAAQEPEDLDAEDLEGEEIAAESSAPSPFPAGSTAAGPMAGPMTGPMAAAELVRSAPAQKRQRDRFPWVRTKLRPGEKWKRRLPKVAW